MRSVSRICRLPLWSGVLTVLLVATVAAVAQEPSSTNMDILRDKVKADKKLLIAANLGLTDAEGAKFWPIYEEYQKELEGLNQRLGHTIEAYAEHYNARSLTDDKAKSLMEEVFDIEIAEIEMKKKCLATLDGVVPALKATRYLQMENKVRALVKFDLAQSIPLVE